MDTNPENKSISIKDKIREQLNRLDNQQDDFDDILQNLVALLISANPRDIQQVASEINLGELFHKFNMLPPEDIEDSEHKSSNQSAINSVITIVLEALPIDEIFVKYHKYIIEGLRSSKIPIIEIWMKKICKPLFTNEGLLRNISTKPVPIISILKCIVELLASKSTAIACASHDICVVASQLLRTEFFSPEILDQLKKLKNNENPNGQGQLFKTREEREQFEIRFYELSVDISNNSEALLEMMKAHGFLTDMIKDSQTKLENDPLIAVNIMKLITDLASKSHGLEFLKNETSLLPFIAKKISEINEDDIFGMLVLPGYINFFIKIAESDLKILNEYPIVINKLVEICQPGNSKTSNHELRLLAIESIAFLCRKSEAKSFLANQMKIFLETIVSMINSGKNEFKSRAIISLNGIMEIQGADPGGKANQLTESWYEFLDSTDCGLNRFMKIVLEPFLDIRIPALNFLRVLATTLWGQKLLANHSEFLDYLLDRSTENSKEGREAKFSIVNELAMSPFLRLTFPPESQLRIRGYFKNGPIYKEVNVAFENS